MSAVEIVNPVSVDELLPWITTMLTTFLADPTDVEEQASGRAAGWDPLRVWGARADGRWVATLRTLPRLLTIPGATQDLKADALTNVTVAATHRRRGLLMNMLTHSLAHAKQRGDAVSILIAAEWPIYGRYGYAPATDGANYSVYPRTPYASLLAETSGTVRQVDAQELGAIAPGLFAAARRTRAGNINRPQDWWDRELGLHGIARMNKRPPVYVVHEGEDGVDGYLSWTPSGGWGRAGELGELTVRELVAAGEQAYIGLWHYLLGVDVVERIVLDDRPVDEPLRWLLADGRAIRETYRGDDLWLRLLDVEAALSLRRYATDDQLVLEIIDNDGAGFAAGRYRLDGGPAHAECVRTDQPADLRLSQRALAAAYLGGFSLSSQRAAGGVEQVRHGALARADAMFLTPVAPWCATGF